MDPRVHVAEDERLRDVSEAIRVALERLVALGEADRDDLQDLRHTLSVEQQEFENRVTAKLDDLRQALAADLAAQVAAVDEKVAALHADVSITLDRAHIERDADRAADQERHEAVMALVGRMNDGWASDLEELQGRLQQTRVGDLQQLQARLEKTRADDLEQLLERIEKGQAAVLEALSERSVRDSERDNELDRVLAAGRSRLDAVAEQLTAAVEGVGFDQAALEDAAAKAANVAAEKLWEAVDQMRVGAADDRDRSHAELIAALTTLGDDVRALAEEQEQRIRAELTANVGGLADRWRADLDQLRSQSEHDRTTTVDALKGLLAARQDELGAVLADQRPRLDAVDERLGSIAAALGVEQERLTDTVIERVEQAVTALVGARRRDDGARAEALEARLDARVQSLGAKVDDALDKLKSDQSALSARLAAKIDEATAALAKTESHLDAEAAEERSRWRSELTELLDTFGHGFRLMSDEQEQRLDEAIRSIRADVAGALERARSAPKAAPAKPRPGGSTRKSS